MKEKPTYNELLKKVKLLEKKITDNTTKTSELKKSHKKYESLLNTIFNGISDPVYVVDREYNIVIANQAMFDFQEIKEEKLIGKPCYKVLKNRNEICPGCYIKKIFKTGKTEVIENLITTEKGNLRYIDSVIYPIFDQNGNVKQVIEIARDITARKKMESQLKQSNDTLITVLDNIEAIIYVADIKTYEILFLNKYAQDIFGDVVGKTCYNSLQEGQNKPCDFCTNSLLLNKEGKPRGTVILDYQNTKTKRWYHVANSIIDWIDGDKVKIEIGVDITDYKNAETALRKSEINHRTFLQNLDGISYQTKLYSFNPLFIYGKVKEITGYEIKNFIHKVISWDQIVHPDDKHLLDDRSYPVNEKESVNCEKTYRIIRKDGTIRWLNDISSHIKLPDFDMPITNGIIYDITDKKLAQEAIIENERKYRLIYENSAIGIISSSIKDLMFINVNQKFSEIIGYTKEELYKMSLVDITYPDDLPDDKKRIDKLLQGKTSTFSKEKRYIHKNGNIIWGNITVSLIRDDKGKPYYLTATIEDISKRKKAEEILLKSEARLKELIATKDKFFSIIAHDLKNPFNTMLGFTELLMDNAKEYDTEKNLEIISILNETAQNSYRLLENLLEWSRTQTGTKQFNPRKTQLSKVVDFNIQLLRKSAQNKNIKLLSMVKDNIFVHSDIDMLNTILRNLISNAVKFTLTRGKVLLTAEKYKSIKNNNEIKISVIDNGIGIRNEDFEKLFRIDINHSTKGTGNEFGSGLGLILCKEFVNKHNGKIWVINNKDSKSKLNFTSGCNFSFTLQEWQD